MKNRKNKYSKCKKNFIKRPILSNGKTSISTGGIQPYPYRGDIGSALARQIHHKQSSWPLKDYMNNRLKLLKDLLSQEERDIKHLDDF